MPAVTLSRWLGRHSSRVIFKVTTSSHGTLRAWSSWCKYVWSHIAVVLPCSVSPICWKTGPHMLPNVLAAVVKYHPCVVYVVSRARYFVFFPVLYCSMDTSITSFVMLVCGICLKIGLGRESFSCKNHKSVRWILWKALQSGRALFPWEGYYIV